MQPAKRAKGEVVLTPTELNRRKLRDCLEHGRLLHPTEDRAL